MNKVLGQRLDGRNKVQLYRALVNSMSLEPGDYVYFARDVNASDTECWYIVKHSVGSVVDKDMCVEVPKNVREQMGLEYGDMLYFNLHNDGRWHLQHERDAIKELQEAFDEIDNIIQGV